ncbi:hypothetical protein MUK42_00884 [Musa troglodytarum]|uniref:GOLD domain-containing protein n=1 Tax=Musa troglodytarum TaxID=320322 RepID=A0A9E7JUP7_9LILI|nr:hypothetical protein MUK42_00884 [Musa troglodytarum]
MASSAEGLVPITRVFLARYYDTCPLPPLSEDVSRLTAELRELSDGLARESPLTSGEELLVHEVDRQPAHKIDENLWKNRENMEEILFLLEECHRPRSLQEKAIPEHVDIAAALGELEVKLRSSLKTLEAFQQNNADNVFNTVMTYMPQDFRGSLIRQQRERSERNRQAEVDALINSGGSIHDRYALLWQQQMERWRRQLAQLGSASGVYKTLVKYLVGVPQVLLDFIRQINDDQGPMEEQRQRYGPSLYSLTKMVLNIRLFLLLTWGRFEEKKIQMDQISLLQHAVDLYTHEFEKFIKFISKVYANSPFFIRAEDAGATESRHFLPHFISCLHFPPSLNVFLKKSYDDYKETIIPPGKTHEITLTVESINSYIAWDFSLIQGTLSQDIGFHVEYVNPSGDVTLILPYRRYVSDQGNFCTILAGSYKLKWDNSYSTFSKKSLRYKVDAVPPVVDAPQPIDEP